MPLCGSAACEPLPVMRIRNSLLEAMIGPLQIAKSPAARPGQLCMPKIASMGKRSNRPSFIISRAPPPPSSAGWKMQWTVPEKRSRWAASSCAAASSIATWPSWPQACMRPGMRLACAKVLCSVIGSASMSARRPMARFEPPGALPRIVPTTPVRPSPRCTSMPQPSSVRAMTSAVRTSSKQSSGWAWMSRRIATMGARSGAFMAGHLSVCVFWNHPVP